MGSGSPAPHGMEAENQRLGQNSRVLAPSCSGYNFVLPRAVDPALYHYGWLAIRQNMQTRYHEPLLKPTQGSFQRVHSCPQELPYSSFSYIPGHPF